MAGLDAAARKTDDLAIAPGNLARKDRGPVAGHLAHRRLDDHRRRRPSRGELLEITPVRDADVGHRPHLGRVDQPSVGIEQIKPADMRQRRQSPAQHLMRTELRHVLLELVGGLDLFGPQIVHDVVVDMLEIAELLVEMPRQQQRGVVELAFGHLQGTLAKLQREIAGAKRNRKHQQRGTQDEPLNGADPGGTQHTLDRQPPVFRHHAVR
ncbi:hypothetical protein chiPu_0031012 [Chiloscyllium punctatum]|uniref:Uncharacterized protein n=1 Tax=Chiloscyllium punctatum TaxID=137246 RepID=A0A401TV64_CHIPU|nr:hypothetical protein [Chiloscyllium punctatum]